MLRFNCMAHSQVREPIFPLQLSVGDRWIYPEMCVLPGSEKFGLDARCLLVPQIHSRYGIALLLYARGIWSSTAVSIRAHVSYINLLPSSDDGSSRGTNRKPHRGAAPAVGRRGLADAGAGRSASGQGRAGDRHGRAVLRAVRRGVRAVPRGVRAMPCGMRTMHRDHRRPGNRRDAVSHPRARRSEQADHHGREAPARRAGVAAAGEAGALRAADCCEWLGGLVYTPLGLFVG